MLYSTLVTPQRDDTVKTKEIHEPETNTTPKLIKTKNATDESNPSLSRKKEAFSKLEEKVYVCTARN